MKKVSLKKGLELLGFSKVEVNRGYNYRSGFMEKEGQTYYFSTFDLRDTSQSNSNFLMIRTAKDRKDYTGGRNTYYAVDKLAEMGYVLNVPFAKCDFNRD
jgi:hypothetical protein